MDRIVKDSSIWVSASAYKVYDERDTSIRVGVVKEVKEVGESKKIKYVVEVMERGNQIPVLCTPMVKFGGVYNFEEYAYRGYEPSTSDSARGIYSVLPGDDVLIAYIGGDSREGVILGSLRHPGRKNVIKPTDGIAYASEFNGVNTQINKDGEYIFTVKGQPKNIAKLDVPVTGNPIPEPEYNAEVGSTYFKFDKMGGWMLNDNATQDPQSIEINKSEGKMTVTSGKIVITLNKKEETISVVTKTTSIESKDKFSIKTKDYSAEASASVKIKSPKIAIGSGGVELLDKLSNLVDKLGMLTIISPTGPCATVSASPQWAQVMEIKTAIDSIKGSL